MSTSFKSSEPLNGVEAGFSWDKGPPVPCNCTCWFPDPGRWTDASRLNGLLGAKSVSWKLMWSYTVRGLWPCRSVMVICPSSIASFPRENPCCSDEEEGAEEVFCPSDAKFHTPCASLINSTWGCARVSESTCRDLCSKGSNCTEMLNS